MIKVSDTNEKQISKLFSGRPIVIETSEVLEVKLTEVRRACTPCPEKSCGALQLTVNLEPEVLFKGQLCYSLVW